MNVAIFRTIQMSFWTDTKVLDDFTPEDKYFYLYLMTNPHTNLIGCYEISLKQMSDETGYTKETIEKLLDRFINVHQVIKFSKSNKEILLLNWNKHNWTKSEKLDKPLISQFESVKTAEFKRFLADLLNQRDRVSIPYPYPMDTTVTITNTNINNIYINNIKIIIDYLNTVCGTRYKYSENTASHIKARLKEGFTVDDFKMVIDKKFAEWGSDYKMSRYLRPQTLFSTKFESYLNQKGGKNVGSRVDGYTRADAEADERTRRIEEYIANGGLDDDDEE